MASTEVATQTAAELAVADKVAQLGLIFQDAGFALEDSNDEAASLNAALEIALRIANAQTIDEVLDPGSTMSGQDLVGFPFRIVGPIVARRSTFKGGLGFYLQFDAEVTNPKTGEVTVQPVSIGALNPMVQLARAAQLGGLDRTWRVVEGNETARGYKPLWLAAG